MQILDGYCPWSVTCTFWQAIAPSQRAFVANPAQGSRHNWGCAVDVSLVDVSLFDLTISTLAKHCRGRATLTT
ncbi:MAG: hypothetical protein ACUVRV_12540 [Cyanobacteriota bacterium]